MARRRKWDWARHRSRTTDDRWAYKVMNWNVDGKRSRGRQKTRWRDAISKFSSNKHFHRVAQDRIEWMRFWEAFAQDIGLLE